MLHSALGLVALMVIAWLASAERSRISRLPWRMIVAGLALQFGIAGLVLKIPAFKALFMGLNGVVHALEEATRAGTSFVFGFVGGGQAPFTVTTPALTFSLAFQALPLVILIAALASLLFYWGILQRVVRLFSLVLEKAQKAIYKMERVDTVPAVMKKKYLLRSRDRQKNLVRIAPEVRKNVRFRRLNFMAEDFEMRESMDLIFCRNVIIYFDRPTQERLLNRLYDHLIPGGYMFMGHSETLSGLNVPLQSVGNMIYRKPL